MCSAPKIQKTPAPPPPPPVIEQVAPTRRLGDTAVESQRRGTKDYRAGKPSLTIGGLSGSTKTGVGGVGS